MTGIVPKDSRFSDWYYHKDPTHVSFYTNDTISWIGNWMHWEIPIPRTNVILFKKPKNQTQQNRLIKGILDIQDWESYSLDQKNLESRLH